MVAVFIVCAVQFLKFVGLINWLIASSCFVGKYSLGRAWASPFLVISTWTSSVCLSVCHGWTVNLP